MKANEIAKYLPYADKNQDYRLITAEQYLALLNIAIKYNSIYNKIREDKGKTNAELSVIKEMIMITDNCCEDI